MSLVVALSRSSCAPQAEGRLRGEVDKARGYHDGARRVVCVVQCSESSFCLFSSRWQAFIRRALPQRIAYDIRYEERDLPLARCGVL